ncbi:molecular chaperone [Mesorhizobium sp.]|uniref:Hsp70 family protein n=1 Tax=Mesorhizobium sp. TaxID=1871066 RepID=UPI000FE69481|nr:molecular chaperone [Mesorhizobium sp.]RWI04388.1 MAG: molecular chaperone [Mesorhizobium sp.]RWM87933.1 MAG: molecular chaperone [Mesorhizobium sp.]TJW50016.1 MAG: molecular chaperone [Mesorhizobium sp.]
MSLKKLPFISSVQLARIDDSQVIPTALFYEGKKAHVGRDARDKCTSPELLIEDFKIELGNNDPDRLVSRSSLSNAARRTPVGLAKDFFEEALRKINGWLASQGLAVPTRILIAEPLSLGGSELAAESWLAHYRKSIKKALYGKFEEIDFMPEPFAVFQYYRYGLRHPSVAEQRKHVALVLDFGGGTFDVSVVETTKAGDISGGGVNSRPLGATSIQVGGFYINRILAEELLFSVLGPRIEKAQVRKSLTFFYQNKNADEEDIADWSQDKRTFFRHYKRLLQDVERAKISICNSIANWNLAADLSGIAPYPISIPVDPFTENAARASKRLDAAKIKAIYTENIWNAKLKEAVSRTIDRAKDELGGQEITVVLLSGGSSNIRWLRSLLERDLKSHLQSAQILELSENFSEIVAKGLATECARRYYTGGQGDFRAVTYNRLCLLLRSDDGELELKHFRPISENLKQEGRDAKEYEEAVLLPAARSLRGLMGQALRWKVKLAKPPKANLSYYFMRSSFDPDDLDSRHNVVQTRIPTPKGAVFQQGIEIELVVREDGTAEPAFYYGKDNRREGTRAVGEPFYMDMTFAAEEVPGETYLGFDFGTSTSACSFVSSSDIQWIEERSKSADWLELAELVNELPYPVAAPLARYMSEKDSQRRLDRGRDAIEAMLTLMAYTTLAEYSTLEKQNSAHFKGMAHRSAGPLWAILKNCLKASRSELPYSTSLLPLTQKNLTAIDNWIDQIANSKHGRGSNIDYVSFLSLLGNTLAKTFGDSCLGVFEGVTPKRFGQGRFKGLFRELKGPSQTFIHVHEYEGYQAFSDEDVYIVQPKTGVALSLSPWYIWGLNNSNTYDEIDLFEYDTSKTGGFVFKAVQPNLECTISASGNFGETAGAISALREREQKRELVRDLTFSNLD